MKASELPGRSEPSVGAYIIQGLLAALVAGSMMKAASEPTVKLTLVKAASHKLDRARDRGIRVDVIV